MAKNLPAPLPDDSGEFILYQTEDGQTRIDVRVTEETVWLSQRLLSELYGVSVKTANEHLINIYEEGELDPAATIRKFRIVQTEGKREVSRIIDHYSLDAIISVGYRVRSLRGTQFRVWATARLREYLVKGFAMDDRRLKQAGRGNYFEELLARIRDIRSSERVFWRKVLDIYATSIDYDGKADESQLFFKTVQNKIHWAAHGHTAAETYYLLFFMEVATRRIHFAACTPTLGDNLMKQVARNLTDPFDGFLKDSKYVLMDRDTNFSCAFRTILEEAGVEPVRLPPKSPNLNAYLERFHLSIKSECLDRMIFFGEKSLRNAVRQYLEYYHTERNHQSLENQIIEPGEEVGRCEDKIQSRERLGGMLRYYYRDAA